MTLGSGYTRPETAGPARGRPLLPSRWYPRSRLSSERSLLVVDDDPSSRRLLAEALASTGWRVTVLENAAAALDWLRAQAPTLIVLGLGEAGAGRLTVLDHVRQRSDLGHVPVIVLLEPDSDTELEHLFESGADDYVKKPFLPRELIARIHGQLRLRGYVERLAKRERDQETVVELTQKLASTLDVRDILFLVVKRLAELAGVDRCSIVLMGESGNIGYVLATSDDADLRDLPIDLDKYPEIREVLSTRRPLVIEDAIHHPLLGVVRQAEPPLGFNSLALVPILHDQGALGVLFLRAKAKRRLLDQELSLVTTVANAAAISLRNARMLQRLRDETAQSTFARAEAERRVQLFQRYADFFESAADGMVVIDHTGTVLFANPRAIEITGYAGLDLTQMGLTQLLDPVERERAGHLLAGFVEGVFPRGIDLTVRKRTGERIVVNVSFSSVLHENDAIVLTFRDVTVERSTAIELKRTKEFLESVIDSSVDGIVSANLRGIVLLFNRAASRIFGYAPEDVRGKMRVEDLYPPGGARDVMRKIRDPAFSGHGRLEDYRVDMLGSGGRPIPVLLSASLVMDNGHPIGSVGIFTDIRDKLRMEAELERTQDELRTREKQAIVAELAGAAAHELNQPLTSVMGYSELLLRQLSDSPEHANALKVIIEEAERMAEIVRKVGRITKYETKSYVGEAKILDLEKATGEEPAPEESRR